MAIRKGNAHWEGNLWDGKGTLSTETGVLKNISYDASSRFAEGKKTNPEELIGAAHSACFSMALANILSGAGYTVKSLDTEDKVHIVKGDSGFSITKIEISTTGVIDGIDEAEFKKQAENAKKGCPVSKALTGVEMVLQATLKK
jgi:lipoyl-dependent peroxiredoxin